MTPEKIQQWREEYLEFRKANIAGHLECYLAARSKAQEEIDGLLAACSEDHKTRMSYLGEIEQLKKQLEGRTHELLRFEKLNNELCKQISKKDLMKPLHISLGDNEIAHLKSLLTQAVPWVDYFKKYGCYDRDEAGQWLKQVEAVK